MRVSRVKVPSRAFLGHVNDWLTLKIDTFERHIEKNYYFHHFTPLSQPKVVILFRKQTPNSQVKNKD